MAHFAELDENNVVLRVIVINNNELMEDGIEIEAKGIAFCQSLFGADTRWVQASYNSSFRGNFANIGCQYDPIQDIFTYPDI